MEKKYTIIFHPRCGWVSPPMDDKALGEFGVPWYCGSCGEKVVRFAEGRLQELNEWKKDYFALKEGKCETERLREECRAALRRSKFFKDSLYAANNEIDRLREALRKVDACLSEKEVGWYERIEDAQNKIFDALLERDD